MQAGAISSKREWRPSLPFLGVLKLFNSYKEQLPSPAVTMALKTPFTVDFYEGPHSPDVNVRQFGFNNPNIQAQDAHPSIQQLSMDTDLCFCDRDQNRGLVSTLGKLQPNHEVLNPAGVGFECQCLTAVYQHTKAGCTRQNKPTSSSKGTGSLSYRNHEHKRV